ncbi:MAG: U32 family peptidase [Candidatus Pacebacteria bacterium]|nr:U32 family peptidase [Candidatus Paceibacterota bacterium]
MVELMSPIKNKASFEACKKYADGVYFSVSDFSMRAKANLSLKDLPNFVSNCHKNKIKAYLALNSVIYNNDLKKLENIVQKAKKSKVDSLIVWDPATIELAQNYKIPFFISTQANVSNFKAVNFYEKIGAKRVILARELSLEQIKEIKKNTKIEIEVFVHGAMCLAISGRCTLSAYFENKSANKGSCYQLCRREWTMLDRYNNKLITTGKYFLSPKDLCMIEYIPELIEAGIDAFKIEGRNRDPKYIATTARTYKEAIKAYYNKTFSKKKAQEWKKELQKVYNRNFTTGFYFGEPTASGINFTHSGSAASLKKILLGNIIHYYPKDKVGVLLLKHQGLQKGEKISIEGETTFFEQEIESIQVNKKKINSAQKGQEIGIKVKNKVRKNDKVFVIKE